MNRIVSANSPLWKKLLSLTKPGIIMGNLIPMLAGFFMASGGRIQLVLIPTLLGTAFIIACGCVTNNYFDRDIDGLMERTKHRLLAKNEFSLKGALFFAFILGVLGVISFLFVNILTLICGLLGLFVYVILYTMLTKRNSTFSIHIGSISGAVPPVIGYVSVTNNLDLGAVMLFLILALWQIPHSYAIAIFRAKDYQKAGIVSLLVKEGMKRVKISMFIHILLFAILNIGLTFFGYTGVIHLVNASLLCIYWVYLSFIGFKVQDDEKWGRKMFFISIIIITLSCITIAFG